MQEFERTNHIYSYLFYGTALLIIMLSLFVYNAAVIFTIAAMMVLSSVYLNSGHILNNLLIKRSKIIEVYNNYRLAENLNAAVRRSGNYYHGTSVSILRVNREVGGQADLIRSILESVREPFEFSLRMNEVNRNRLIESLETKRRVKEIALSRAGQKQYDKMNKLKREIAVLENDINNVIKGGKSFETIIKLRTFYVSDNQNEAGREAYRNLIRISDIFATSLGLEYEVVRSEKLLEVVNA